MSDNFFFRSSGGYLLHQATEKYLKALRKVVRPQVKIEKHGHDLRKILGDLKGKIGASSFEKITELVKDVEALEQFRYMDQKVSRDMHTMQKGLEATDCLVTSLRESIDSNSPLIAGKGLRRYMEGSNNKDQNLLIDSLLRDNSSRKYWINHLSGINARIDRKLRQY